LSKKIGRLTAEIDKMCIEPKPEIGSMKHEKEREMRRKKREKREKMKKERKRKQKGVCDLDIHEMAKKSK